MKNTDELFQRCCRELGEDVMERELAGILRKHEGLSRRQRSPGRVARALQQVLRDTGGAPPARIAAKAAIGYSLGPASLYRLLQSLKSHGIHLSGVAVHAEIQRQKKGIY
ncbi:MAG: hypothetical protein LUQ40_03925 [Methanomicrobiales archaeon]|nr:hypothetical protein [Methanomicrobiales archaeon]